MKKLAIDTSSKFLCIAFKDEDRLVFNYRKKKERQTTYLFCVLQGLLRKYNQRIENIDLFCVGLGPGSFTGLRVGLSSIKGLVFALGKKILGVSTLDIIAKNIKEKGDISVILDAKRGNVYSAFYKNGQDLLRTSSYLLLNFRDWMRRIKKKTFVLGDAIGIYKDELYKNKNIICVSEKYWYPDARNLIELSDKRFKNKSSDNIIKINPLYLYPKECQIRR
jgi:tRNA threonylcarbamoyladenosine biosynthesis protein TsaB